MGLQLPSTFVTYYVNLLHIDKEDFTRIAPTTLVFNKNTSTTTIEIPIMDDLLPEGIESFEVELKSFSTIPSSEMRINPKSAVVFIRDDDGRYLSA